MKCPNCANTLSERMIENIKLDVCDNGCGGIWFDRFELKKFDEAREPNAESLLNLKIRHHKKPDANTQLKCPKCADRIMMRHFSSLKKQVQVDHCPECAGYWLDASELTAIRNEYNSDAERQAAAENLVSETLKSAPNSDFETARKIGHALRYLSPSYYRNK